MSQYRIEKQHHVSAAITLVTGTELRGTFFLAEATTAHSGPERVYDLLNDPDRFFPFDGRGIGIWIALIAALGLIVGGLLRAGEEL